ncbi:hypothetical protein D3C71_2148150 [compost metagenome]
MVLSHSRIERIVWLEDIPLASDAATKVIEGHFDGGPMLHDLQPEEEVGLFLGPAECGEAG